MTGLGGSRPIQQRMAYVQDQAPTDRRDGVMWLDTSDPQRPLYQWSVAAQDWEQVIRVFDGDVPSNPRDGDLWTDRSQDPPVLKQYDGSISDWRRSVPVAEQSAAPDSRDVSVWIDDANDLYTYNSGSNSWEKPIPSSTRDAGPVGGGWVAQHPTKSVAWWDADSSTGAQFGMAGGETFTWTQDIPTYYADEIRVDSKEEHDNYYLNVTKIEARIDGVKTTVWSGSFQADGRVLTANFDGGEVDRWEITFNNTDSINNRSLLIREVAPHTVSMPKHSHSI